MAKYDQKFKTAVVQEYLSGTGSYWKLGAKHGLGHATILDWVARYRAHGDQGLRKKFGRYDAQFKLTVLRAVSTR